MLWLSDITPDVNWRTVDFKFIAYEPLRLVWRAKRILSNSGAFGGGDIAVDDIRLTECPADEAVSTTVAPLLGALSNLLSSFHLSVFFGFLLMMIMRFTDNIL